MSGMVILKPYLRELVSEKAASYPVITVSSVSWMQGDSGTLFPKVLVTNFNLWLAFVPLGYELIK